MKWFDSPPAVLWMLALASIAGFAAPGCQPNAHRAASEKSADAGSNDSKKKDNVGDTRNLQPLNTYPAIDPIVAEQPKDQADREKPEKKPSIFDEPAGISYANGKLYIADTNNHLIRTIDLNDDYKVATLTIAGLQPPAVAPEPTRRAMSNGDPRQAKPHPPTPVDLSDPRAATPRPPMPPWMEDARAAIPRPPMPPPTKEELLLAQAFPFGQRIDLSTSGFDFPQAPDRWINTAKPLKLEDLKGKFVMLDFWTYCCINCIHILPELKKLERAYPNDLVVIGVHSAKFEAEKDSGNIAEAVLRYEIEHPVLNDSEQKVWNQFGVQAWPTVIFIDPEGNGVGRIQSEFTFEDVDAILQRALPYYREKGVMNERPMKFDLLRDKQNPSPLRFPGKLLADEKSGRLFIADSNNNRLVICTLDGKLIDTIGTGAIGQKDGGYAEATFNKPQGMALRGETLYVADTENHLLRKIDLAMKTVTTIAGKGVQGRNSWPGLENARTFADLPEQYTARPLEFAINSPWDLYIHEDDLYIAMAGPHQIWKMKLDESEIGPFAGDAYEDVVDGKLLPPVPPRIVRRKFPNTSSFAQPSGLTSDGEWLYVADSEGSSIRAVPFDPEKEVKTIVGSSKLPYARLFAFGNRDGLGLLKLDEEDNPLFGGIPMIERTSGPALQHCLGVVYHNGKLYAADTYNNAIKEIDPVTATCKTIAGDLPSNAGEVDFSAALELLKEQQKQELEQGESSDSGENTDPPDTEKPTTGDDQSADGEKPSGERKASDEKEPEADPGSAAKQSTEETPSESVP